MHLVLIILHWGEQMLTREQILDSLKHLTEPTYQLSYVKLNLIRDIMIKEESVSLSILTTQEDELDRDALKLVISEALQSLNVTNAHVRVRTMSDFDRQEITKKISGPTTDDNQAGVKIQNPDPNVVLKPESGVQFIAVSSGKGGVGKSTVTVNLAVALSRLGKKVGIIDADIYGFSVPDMMGIEDRPVVDESNAIKPVERFGVKVMSMGFFVEDNTPVIWRGPMLGKMLRNFFAEVKWGELDFLLLDMPPGTGDIALDVNQMIPQSQYILVTTPHATASFVAARAGSMAIHTKHSIIGVVENMAYYECSACGEKDYVFGKGGGAKLAAELNTHLLAQIPLGAPDNHIAEADYAPSIYKEDSPTGKLYEQLAKDVIAAQ
jgi:ATP-binding protein involved in chromosome partitioning